MTKNELDAVIRTFEEATYKAYLLGREDALKGVSMRDERYFKMGLAGRMLLLRELERR